MKTLFAAGRFEEIGAYFHETILAMAHAQNVDPDELFQSAMLKLCEAHKRGTYDPSRPFRNWFLRLVSNARTDLLREVKKHYHAPDTHFRYVIETPETPVDSSILSSLLARLKPAQSRAVKLRKIDGLSYREASRRTGIAINRLKEDAKRGMRNLRVLGGAQ